MKHLLLLTTIIATLAACSTTPQIPENCEIRVDGECFTEARSACAAAGCPDSCIILETYPGQVQCASDDNKASANPDAPVSSPGATRLLFVLSGHTELGDTGVKTGYFLSEVAHPWHVVTEAGFTVDFVSPRGGAVEMDPKSNDLKDPINKAFMANPANVEALATTMKPSDVDPSKYRAIYFAGGHGAMWDFADNAELAALAAQIYEADGVVGAVCHGPAGLVNIKLSDGSYLVAGKRVAAFTNAEEAAVELTDVMPFLLETKLEERGADHVPAANFQEHVVVDQRLVTGQNPASATAAGEAMVKLLEE